jgi:phosphatidylglycerophosphate synthase
MANTLSIVSQSVDNIGRNIVAVMRKIRRPVTFAACRLLIHLHINQSHITLVRTFLLIGFYFAWVNSVISVAMGLMLSAWILDCTDGDLSRMLHNDNALGEFEDVMGDNFACLIFPLALIQAGQLCGVIGGLFIFSAFSVMWIANKKQTQDGQSISLTFSPKGNIFLSLSRKVVWVLMYLFVFFKIDIFNPTYTAITLILSISLVVCYYQIIRSRLKFS